MVNMKVNTILKDNLKITHLMRNINKDYKKKRIDKSTLNKKQYKQICFFNNLKK